MWPLGNIVYIPFLSLLLLGSIRCLISPKNHFIRRASVVHHHDHLGSWESKFSNNINQHEILGTDSSHYFNRPSASTSWPPELPKKLKIKSYSLPPTRFEEEKPNRFQKLIRTKSMDVKVDHERKKEGDGIKQGEMMKSPSGTSKSQMKKQYEKSKNLHRFAQSMLEDQRWEKLGKITATAMGIGAIKAYDKCKALVGRIRNTCSATYHRVRKRIRGVDR